MRFKINMKIIISPSKTMKKAEQKGRSPVEFMETAEKVLEYIKSFSKNELTRKLKISDEMGEFWYTKYKNMDLKKASEMAICKYSGEVFKNIDYNNLSEEAKKYLDENLVIMSALYGIVCTFSSIHDYRMDFENDKKILDYWKENIYNYLKNEDLIINLASKEYSQFLKKYDLNILDIEFKILRNGKIARNNMLNKKMRGKMVNFLAKNLVTKDNYKEIFTTFSEEGFTLESLEPVVFVRRENEI